MDRASLPNPKASNNNNNSQRTSTSDSKSGGIRLHSLITEVASSEATSARVRVWLEGIEQSTKASESDYEESETGGVSLPNA